ncbi:LamG-like jellyroll fold domain-containing protein [uncultured Parabacteroides sp.]|uniref:LamG-like jellyroll fold domain-containing protein n=1 Tax=uncultured Parabacteroides sp. TaxID=512312 RepID=UPI00263298D5|nr:LamG-like jellyroll fold domain-containing protein [uncultured Parabacteroides sp.]
MLLLVGWQEAGAYIVTLDKVEFTEHLKDGYIELRLPVYESKDNDEGLDYGSLTADGKEILRFYTMEKEDTWQSDGDTKWIKAKAPYGYGEIESQDGKSFISLKKDYNEYTLAVTKGVEDNTYDVAYARFRWYVPSEWGGSDLDFAITLNIDYNGDSKGLQKVNKGLGKATGGTFPTPQLSYQLSTTPGCYNVTYTGISSPKDGSQYNWSGGGWITSTASTGSTDYKISNQAQDVTFTYAYKMHGYAHTNRAATISLKSFHYPDELKLADAPNGATTISWTINNSGLEDFSKTGKFEVQRATDVGFSQGVKSVGIVELKSGKSEYSITDPTGNDNLIGTVYYRLRRADAALWEWKYVVSSSIQKVMTHQNVASAKVERLNWSTQPQAKISWTLEEKTDNIIWSDGARVIVKRTKDYGGGRQSTDEVVATEADMKNGYLIDELNMTCVNYTYSVYVKPGNNNYPALNPIPVYIDPDTPILPTLLGMVTSIEVSKGYYPNHTTIEWETDGNPIDQFEILRREYIVDQGEDTGWKTIETREGSQQTTFIYNDQLGVPGMIYEYRVAAVTTCVDKKVSNPSAITRGFRSPTGIISGRITYSYGDAVPGVDVMLSSKDLLAGQSLLFTGNENSYIETDEAIETPANFAVQAFVKPTTTNQTATIVSFGRYSLGLENGKPAFKAKADAGWTVADTTLLTMSFTQLTAMYDGSSFNIYVGGELKRSYSASGQVGDISTAKVSIGKSYTGYVDEVRLWSKGLTDVEVKQTYNRLLTGNEEGLIAYWRLNDPVTDEFYDISYSKADYNAHHGKIHNATLSTGTEAFPTQQQLALRGLTDASGNYSVSGIPYAGNGTAYTLTPTHPIFNFDPSEQTVTIGPDAVTMSNINFQNKTAVKVEGYVFYENSSIPVVGATFEVNGQAVVSNGEFVKSGDKGQFAFSVPVGEQTVRVVKANHTFKQNGLLLDSKGINLNYQANMADVRFWDQTKVKLIGRVAGGTVEGNKPLGFSLSKNNLGDNPTLVLQLEGDVTSEIYDKDGVFKDGVIDQNAPDQMDSTMIHWNSKYDNGVSYQQQKIVITPDAETGEYEAWLYPVKYKVTQATVQQGWDGLLPDAAPVVNLENAFTEQTSEYTDEKKGETYRLAYNEEYSLIHRVSPTISYKQGNASGAKTDYFGLQYTTIPDLKGLEEPDTLVLYDKKSKEYLFKDGEGKGLPVFSTGTWGFHIEATEDYAYNGVTEGEGAKVDRVPTQSGEVSITNTFNQNAAPQKATLNDQGRLYVDLVMNKPRFANNDYGSLSIAVTIGDKKYEAPGLKGFLLGADPNTDGLDFVTAGPITLLNILRDPPGSASYTWWESGQNYSYNTMSTKGFTNVGTEGVTTKLGVKTATGIGIGAMVLTETEMENNIQASINHEETTNHPDARTMTVTTNSRYQTSDDPLNVGSAADVFIGFSNNLYYGAVNEIELLDKETYDGKGGEKDVYATTTKDGKTYYICKGSNLNVSVSGSTLFSYPKMHIENIVIPNLETLRNNMLYTPDAITETEAQAMATAQNRMIYRSNVSKDDDTFGSTGSYKIFIPNTGVPEEEQEDEFLTKFLGKKKKVKGGTPDSISMYNNAIKEWVRVLKQNEDEKLAAIKKGDFVERNRSFHASSPVEYTESYEMAKEDGYSFEFTATAGVAAEFGFSIGGAGVVTAIDQQFGGVGSDEQNFTEGETASSGFVLADEGDFDYISVDVLRAAPVDTTFKSKWNNMYNELGDFNDQGDVDPGKLKKCVQYGNFIFKTRGGATACPYEPAEYTQYQDGDQKLLNEATMQIERPSLEVEKPVVTNVPSDKAAVYNLKLMNDSKVSGATAIFTIAIVDAANQKGAKFSIDGVPLGEGRGIEVPYGEVLNKVLEVRRGTEYDYEDLALVLKSQCQSDPTDNQADIADTVYISAHFIPSSSDINIKNPTDKWTLNTQSSLDSTSGKYYMPLTIDGFDVNFTGFDHIEVQYKPSSGSDKDWTNICSFFNDSVPYKAASGEKAMIEGATISTRFYGAEDQKYDIRAVTFSKVGNEFVTKSSPVISGVKDTKRPVVFGNIQPADGVLGIEDEIRLNFNEEIAEGYMTDVKNFQVTAVRNGSNGDHSTSLTFDGTSSYLATQAERNLADKDVSVEMWVLPSTLGQKMTLFSHGTTTNALELSIGADNSIQVSIGGKVYASKPQSFKTTDWAHVAMTYKASNRQLSAYFGGTEVITGVQTSEPNTSIGPMQFGRGVSGDNYFAGKMHEARVWNKVVASNEIMANKLTIYTGQEAGMLAYYPMNDGKGDRVTDKAQGATAWIYGADWSTLAGLSVAFKGDTLMAVNTSKVALTDAQDYTLEFWFKAAPGQKEAALVSNGKGVGDENNTNRNKVFVGFADNKLVFRNNGHEEVLSGKWDDDSWHHFAIAVNRNAGNAQIFLDGALNTYFDAGKLGGFSGTNLYLGARRWTEATQMVDHTDMYLKGQVDELRLWNMALPSTIINKNYNVCPKGSEMGLMLYMPFHKYITNSANVREMVFSGEDLVTDSTLVIGGSRLASEEKAPVRAKGPEVSIPFTFVVNKDALVINLMDTPEALEKAVVNFTVKDVSDLNGNLMQSPVTWSAYINRNQLKWSQSSVTKEKKLYAPMTFMVDVENQGGTEKNFTIEGLPAWLKADPAYGTIDPLGRQPILFTVDEGTNVGRYDEVVYVKGDNNVSEALPVTLKVFDQQPDWTVDPADFKYNMNIYGKLRVNKLFSTDAEDMIAVFDGGRCVGVANNRYVDKNDMWYVFLTVYGNEIKGGEPLNFRVWDASTGTVYDAYCDTLVTFGSNSVVGTASEPVVFDAEERVVQNIDLTEGWNWVSFNVKSDAPDLVTIMKNSMLLGDEQVKDEAKGAFAAYDKESGTWLGSDIVFDNKHMYLIQSSVAQKLSVSGIAIKEKEDLTIPVAAKWNYISYLPMTNLPIAEALSGYSAKEGDIIKSQNAFSMYGVKTGWLGNMTYMEPGKGYMLLNNGEGTSLVYPDMMGGNDLRSGDLPTRSGGAMTSGTTCTDTRFDANMSVVATVAESLPVYAGDKLQAYVGGELRGEALLTEDPYDGRPLYFVSIGGDRNEAVSFALERGGEVIAETSPMFDYRTNNVQGSIEQPVIIDFVNDLQISVYPNPFERELNFVMDTEPGSKIEIYLYTMAGQMIHRHAETSVNGGYLHYRWECYEDLARTVYMAVVVVNGKKHVYKIKRK